QHVARVFNAVTADFGSLQNAFHFVGQSDDGALGVNVLHGATNNGAFLVQGGVVGERIVFQLLDAQVDALALPIDRQDHGVQLVALVEATHGFVTGFVPGDAGQVNQAVAAVVQPTEATEIGDRLDGAGDAVALVELTRALFPR